jgi:hypothetical protein
MGERGEIKGGESSGKGGGHIIQLLYTQLSLAQLDSSNLKPRSRSPRVEESPSVTCSLSASVPQGLNLSRLRMALRGPSISTELNMHLSCISRLTNLATAPVTTYSMHLIGSHALLLAGGMREENHYMSKVSLL